MNDELYPAYQLAFEIGLHKNSLLEKLKKADIEIYHQKQESKYIKKADADRIRNQTTEIIENYYTHKDLMRVLCVERKVLYQIVDKFQCKESKGEFLSNTIRYYSPDEVRKFLCKIERACYIEFGSLCIRETKRTVCKKRGMLFWRPILDHAEDEFDFDEWEKKREKIKNGKKN